MIQKVRGYRGKPRLKIIYTGSTLCSIKEEIPKTQYGDNMAKTMNAKKNVKKAPQKTPKEKKQAKREKKQNKG